MNYFDQLEANRAEIQEKAQKLLEGRPEKSLNELAEENGRLGWEHFERLIKTIGEERAWNEAPEVIANIADGWVPFTESIIHSNGSIGFSLGLCLEAVEAHAWALNDYLTGKTREYVEPDFPLVAKVTEEQMETMVAEEKAAKKKAAKK